MYLKVDLEADRWLLDKRLHVNDVRLLILLKAHQNALDVRGSDEPIRLKRESICATLGWPRVMTVSETVARLSRHGYLVVTRRPRILEFRVLSPEPVLRGKWQSRKAAPEDPSTPRRAVEPLVSNEERSNRSPEERSNRSSLPYIEKNSNSSINKHPETNMTNKRTKKLTPQDILSEEVPLELKCLPEFDRVWLDYVEEKQGNPKRGPYTSIRSVGYFLEMMHSKHGEGVDVVAALKECIASGKWQAPVWDNHQSAPVPTTRPSRYVRTKDEVSATDRWRANQLKPQLKVVNGK